MRSLFPVVLVLPLLITGCGGAATEEEAAAPAISTSAADNLIPGQLARGAALQTEIRSAGHDCNKVVRTFQQGAYEGGDVWDAECEDGDSDERRIPREHAVAKQLQPERQQRVRQRRKQGE